MGRGGSDDESFPEKCGAHCYEGRKVYTSCCCVGLLVMIILLSMYAALHNTHLAPTLVCRVVSNFPPFLGAREMARRKAAPAPHFAPALIT